VSEVEFKLKLLQLRIDFMKIFSLNFKKKR
jgi:hypothetical protein